MFRSPFLSVKLKDKGFTTNVFQGFTQKKCLLKNKRLHREACRDCSVFLANLGPMGPSGSIVVYFMSDN